MASVEQPLLIGRDRVTVERAAAELAARGWSVRRGLELPARPWDVGRLRIACVATVATEPDAAAALMAAARGAALALAVDPGSPLRARLFEDLSRLARVTLLEPSPADGLQPEQRALLELLAHGATMDDAARALSLSRRTVSRRLLAARTALGARTTAEALARFRAGGDVTPALARAPGPRATASPR